MMATGIAGLSRADCKAGDKLFDGAAGSGIGDQGSVPTDPRPPKPDPVAYWSVEVSQLHQCGKKRLQLEPCFRQFRIWV